ncbi:MAG TPA: hypothetical protein VEN79_11485 [Terriglobia bacterium]|nr:hypothetical protein [Terriglobia bacterium]
MKNKQVLPIPFMILILAGVVSLFSIAATRKSPGSAVKDDSLQMQTVEQERMAAIYFRILSWLADVTPRAAEPVKANPQPAPVLPAGKTPRRGERRGRVELCALHSAQSLAASKYRARNLN